MEQYAYKDLTLADLQRDPDGGRVPRLSGRRASSCRPICPRPSATPADLLEWARRRGTPIWVRLVKGAYWDYETVVGQAHGWPIPVYQQKWESDANFERLTRFLMENYRWLRPALGSHNLRSLSHGIACAEQLGVPEAPTNCRCSTAWGASRPSSWPTGPSRADLHAVRRTDSRHGLSGPPAVGKHVQRFVSAAELHRTCFDRGAADETRPMPPRHAPARSVARSRRTVSSFTNEPPTDFSRAEARQGDGAGRQRSRPSEFGKEYPLVINGRAIEARSARSRRRNPSHKSQVVGHRFLGHAPKRRSLAIDAARRAFKQWSRTEPDYRAEYLELAAAEMRNQRFELAAWEVHECGKPWAEADADVAEAIDFCMYYADQMRAPDGGSPRAILPGEENVYSYGPRGVAAVIAPWNFPLAILTGMTAAALVTGNTVIMKPAEQSSVVGYKLMEILQNVGIPDGVVNYLAGRRRRGRARAGRQPGRAHLIAFTGSRTVGLAINQAASQPDDRQEFVKRVIAEMGGKNAIIIDDDADLDEAVLGVDLQRLRLRGPEMLGLLARASCWNRSTTRSSTSSRRRRCRSKSVRPNWPDTTIGPVIDEEAVQADQRVHQARQRVVSALGGRRNQGPGRPMAITSGRTCSANVDPTSRLAREEIFGPVLAVIKVKDLDEAFDVANDSAYALTGGLFSRSPANLKRARHELQVGQRLSQPRDHRRHGRTPAVRRLQTVGHRHQGGRPRLPLAVRDPDQHHRKHLPPRIRAAGGRELARTRPSGIRRQQVEMRFDSLDLFEPRVLLSELDAFDRLDIVDRATHADRFPMTGAGPDQRHISFGKGCFLSAQPNLHIVPDGRFHTSVTEFQNPSR